MRHEAIYGLIIGGSDISLRVKDTLQSITVQDRAGTSSDTATIVLSDHDGSLIFPRHNSIVLIFMGFKGSGIAQVFSGMVDEVRSTGGRSGGRTITVSAKGLDTSGNLKEPQQRHFDDMTVEAILKAAGEPAGITDVRVDPDLASITRDYEHMDDESFVAFGERLAKEIGGTFKVRNDAAVMAKKNSGRTPAGVLFPPVLVTRGQNLIDWDIAPYIGRARYKQIRVRFYDQKAAKHDEVVVDTGIEGSTAVAVGRFEAKDKQAAEEKANSLKAESERASGVGSVTMDGNAGASPEGILLLAGARIGIDGAYMIDGVDHTYSRSSGFTTRLSLAHQL